MIRALVISLIGSLLLSCVMTPPLYLGLAARMGDSVWPYSRVFDRVIMLWAVVFLFWYRKEFELDLVKDSFKRAPGRWYQSLLLGIGISGLGASLSLVALVYGGILAWSIPESSELLFKAGKVLVTALVVSCIEEVFFRVLLFRQMLRIAPVSVSLVIVGVFYAVVHFISPAKEFTVGGYSPWIGFEYMGEVFDRLLLPGVLPAAFGLFLVGSVLCFAMLRFGSIYLCIGLHAGWVIIVKGTFTLTKLTEQAPALGGAGRRYVLAGTMEGWLSAVVAFLLLFLLSRYRERTGAKDNEDSFCIRESREN